MVHKRTAIRLPSFTYLCSAYEMHNHLQQNLPNLLLTTFLLLEECLRDDKWEIPREKLHIFAAIGEGAFGVVMEVSLDTGIKSLDN